jgi:uncharacterized membrane protein YfcA
MHTLLTLGCGALVGLSLGFFGGGGSVLAVPLLIHVLGVQPHVAIGTSALAVGANAVVNLAGHWRRGNVKWPCAAVFAAAGVFGAAAGARLGISIDGQRLLLLFALAMVAVGFAMLRPRSGSGDATVRIDPRIAARLLGIGVVAGFVSGFFGIGGGFLIVPGLMLATGMPMIHAIGSSLLGVAAFGFTTAASYAAADLLDWRMALQLLAGGVAGGIVGIGLASRLAQRRRVLERLFALAVLALALVVAWRAVTALG